MRRRILLTACLLTSVLSFAIESVAGELLVGAASVSITPSQPVALSGQRGDSAYRRNTIKINKVIWVFQHWVRCPML